METVFVNLVFVVMLGLVAYLLLFGVDVNYIAWRAQREKAARLAFQMALRQGEPRRVAMRAYRSVRREWKKARIQSG
jgi:hypothetical protein